MKTIARVTLDDTHGPGTTGASPNDPWRAVAERCAEWANAQSVGWRDAIVLVPFLEMLVPARRAFARLGVWMPRIETTRTLAASLAPSLAGSADSGFDAALDALVAAQLLAREPWGADWARRDRRGFEQGAKRLVATSHALARAAAAIAPVERSAWWETARAALRPAAGPGGNERLLASVALEWAAAAPPAATDRLFALRPSAWMVVEAGGADPLSSRVLAASDAPAFVIATDVPLIDPFGALAAVIDAVPAFALCDGFEDEAFAAAAQVLDHLGRAERPVALIAQDRVLVRRVRALLERAGVRIGDETGWRLSTTRAGATVMALLRAARGAASTDAYLDWLKASPLGAAPHGSALSALESTCRRRGAAWRDAIAALDLDAGARRVHEEALATLRDLETPARRSLPAWLDALRTALDRCGALALLRDDPAGRQALAALAVDPPLEADRRQAIAGELEAITLAELTHWVDDVFERVAYRPPVSAEGAPAADARAGVDVVITPLARAMLRPFAAVVFPGADSQRLGAAQDDDSLLPRDIAESLAVPGARSRRDGELLAFAQALRLPRVTLLRRRGVASDPVAESPLVDRLRLALAASGRALRAWRDPRIERRVAAAPVRAGAPSVADAALPRRLSQGAVEALRACPYQFFARTVLGLGEADEFDDEVEKRDYGSWLHDVLHRFHRARAATPGEGAGDAAADLARLRASAVAALAETGHDEASFLPFAASFAAFAPRYVEWLHERERAGWTWSAGESELAFTTAELAGVELFGRIDRIDRRGSEGEAALELIDYKTGGAKALKDKVNDRLEDTQLAFYAALVGAHSSLPLRASYLALDGTRGLEQIAHADVAASARALVGGVAAELVRVRAGVGLAPLGAGTTCQYCIARGLCRRDHWTADAVPEDGDDRLAAAAADARSD
jgi:ATP-dependent helicase/nuclease subunit B